jgi:hypothetical protein
MAKFEQFSLFFARGLSIHGFSILGITEPEARTHIQITSLETHFSKNAFNEFEAHPIDFLNHLGRPGSCSAHARSVIARKLWRY